MELPQEVMWLWGAACLIALFGIWYTLWSRLGVSNPSPREKVLSKKERAALEEQQRIEAAAQKMLEQMGIPMAKMNIPTKVEGDGHQTTSPTPSVSQPPNTPEAIRQKYTRRRGDAK